MHRFVSSMVGAVATGLLLTSAQAGAAIITFDEPGPFVSPGETLFDQYYLTLGVTFSANAFSDCCGPSGIDWATNTDMTIVDSAGTDVGASLELASRVSGNILRSFSGWAGEDGDPSFSIDFSAPVSFVSADFAGVVGLDSGQYVQMFAYNGATPLGAAVADTTDGQFRLSFNAPSITRVAIVPGSFTDWVGVDNITFAPVPLPAAAWLLLSGLGGLGLLARRRKA